MVDSVDKATRSRIMARVHSRNTSPEIALRKALFHFGFRYRLHCSTLPGKPDLSFPRYRAVIFIHGCFWHWHGCRSHIPDTNTSFWRDKIQKNQQRDIETFSLLLASGWRVLVVWECALKKSLITSAAKLSSDWLHSDNSFSEIEPDNETDNKSLKITNQGNYSEIHEKPRITTNKNRAK